MYFRKWKDLYFDFDSNEPNWLYPSIGSDNGLAPNRRQAIIWINADPNDWRIYVAYGGMRRIII